MFFHKLRRTFAAMLRGWLACNLITFLAFALWIIHRLSIQLSATSPDLLNGCIYLALYTMMALIYSGVAVVVAWLFVLLPLDLLISESSFLRNPVPAAIFGSFGGFFCLMALWAALNVGVPEWSADPPWLAAFAGLAAITGLTAARHIVRHHPQRQRPSPQPAATP